MNQTTETNEILRNAILGMNFLTMRAIFDELESEGSSFEEVAFDTIHSWLEQIETYAETNKEMFEFIKEDVAYELREGSYLTRGKKEYIDKVNKFFVHIPEHIYCRTLIELIKDAEVNVENPNEMKNE